MLRRVLGSLLVVCVVGFLGLAALMHVATDKVQSVKPVVSPKIPSEPVQQSTIEDHSTSVNKVEAPDEQTYSVSLVDANKNKIPTGTELFVQGTMYNEYWGPTNDCVALVTRDHVNVQHGELDPADYCRFSILLTDKRTSGEDLWPGIGLMCDVTPQEFKEVTHLHHYGEEVRVHGTYAASLDFAIAYLPGGHFGVPVLEDCTFIDPTDNVIRPEVKESSQPPPVEDQPYNY